MNALLTLKNYYLYPKNQPRCLGVDLKLSAGHSLAILGPTGCGKSVFLKSLVGLAPFSGELRLLDSFFHHPLPKLLKFPKRSLPIGFAFEKNALFEFLSVEDNLSLAGAFQDEAQTTQKPSDGERLLKQIGLWESRKKFPRALSGGMKKRLAVARTLIKKPKILICDSPLAGLDPLSAHSIFTMLKETVNTGSTLLVMSLQSYTLALTHFTHLLLLDSSGNPVFCGNIEDFYCKNPHIKAIS